MKDARYLVRLANSQGFEPGDQNALLQKTRRLAAPLQGKVINLRVTPVALEFDLFCEPDLALDPFFEAWKGVGARLTAKRLDVPPPPVDAAAIVTEARHLFNEHRFWEVHEVLEGLWKTVKGPEKELVQGLILAAAALVHVQKDENGVVASMLREAQRRLENQPVEYHGWNIERFREHLSRMTAHQKMEFPRV